MKREKWYLSPSKDYEIRKETLWQRSKFYVIGVLVINIILILILIVHAEPITLIASWYSTDSLKKEGTYAYSHGVMANGQKFDETALCCATRLYDVGVRLRVTNLRNGKSVVVKVTDRVGKRFAHTRIDLSKAAFIKIADLDQGIVKVSVEVIE